MNQGSHFVFVLTAFSMLIIFLQYPEESGAIDVLEIQYHPEMKGSEENRIKALK